MNIIFRISTVILLTNFDKIDAFISPGNLRPQIQSKITRTPRNQLEAGKNVKPLESANVASNQMPKNDNIFKIIYDFSRPHTLIGSALSIPSLCFFASGLPNNLISLKSKMALITAALIPSLLINIYITGLNQISDVEIDRINKPYLPIPNGRLSLKSAKMLVCFCLFSGLGIGLLMPKVYTSFSLLTVLFGSAILGTMYSLPPFRLKRFPTLAAFCILTVRGSLINLCFYTHFKLKSLFSYSTKSALNAFKDLIALPLIDLKCSLLLGFFAVFSVIIALLKDVPDFKGDAQYNIRSFTVRLGCESVFNFACNLAVLLFWGTSLSLLPSSVSGLQIGNKSAIMKLFVSVSAFFAGNSILKKKGPVNPKDPKAVYGLYMHLWLLFFCSYLSLPLLF